MEEVGFCIIIFLMCFDEVKEDDGATKEAEATTEMMILLDRRMRRRTMTATEVFMIDSLSTISSFAQSG